MVGQTQAVSAEAPLQPIVELSAGRLRARVVPETGGALASLAIETAAGEWFDVLRRATPAALQARNPREMACFPMVPFASLVYQGRFSFAGKAYRLRLNLPEHDAAMHGDAWQHPWDIEACTADAAHLAYRQNGDRFPFPYEARQDIRLEPEALVLSLAVTNVGDAPMPAGLGFHPFFSLTPDVTLQFDATAVWGRDEKGRVVALRDLSVETSFADSLPVGRKHRNDIYEGWSRRARIEWQAAGVRAELHAQPPLSRVLVFVPEGRPAFCVEPLCNLPDGFNLLGAPGLDAGITVLKPRETLKGSVRLECRPL